MHTGSRLISTIAQDRHGSDPACNVSAGLDLLTTEPDYKIAITALTSALSVQNKMSMRTSNNPLGSRPSLGEAMILLD